MNSSGTASDKLHPRGRHPRGKSRLLEGCLVFAVLSALGHSGQTQVTSCQGQDMAHLGFVPLRQGIDYPGNDIQYSAGTTLDECLKSCITYPGRDCLMVTFTAAGECWLKNAVGLNTAANSHVSAYALPCYVQSSCNMSLCNQTVGLPSIQCNCTPPGDLGFAPTTPFNTQFTGNDLTWQGLFPTDDSSSCALACLSPDLSCVVALFNPNTRFCNLKRQYDPSSARPEPGWQGFVNYCAIPNNGGCGNLTCESSSPSPLSACIEPETAGFQYLSTNFSYPGMDIIMYPNTDSHTCVQNCSANPQCMIAEMDPSMLQCFLKTGGSTPESAPGLVAFSRIGYNDPGVTPGTLFQTLS